MVWRPYHLGGIWVGFVASGESYQGLNIYSSQLPHHIFHSLQFCTRFEVGCLVASFWVWTRTRTFLDLLDRLFCSFLLAKPALGSTVIKLPVPVLWHQIFQLAEILKEVAEMLRRKGPLNCFHCAWYPIASACALGGGERLQAVKIKNPKEQKLLRLDSSAPFMPLSVTWHS